MPQTSDMQETWKRDKSISVHRRSPRYEDGPHTKPMSKGFFGATKNSPMVEEILSGKEFLHPSRSLEMRASRPSGYSRMPPKKGRGGIVGDLSMPKSRMNDASSICSDARKREWVLQSAFLSNVEDTCEHIEASGWNFPPTQSQKSFERSSQAPWMPMQQGLKLQLQ